MYATAFFIISSATLKRHNLSGYVRHMRQLTFSTNNSTYCWTDDLNRWQNDLIHVNSYELVYITFIQHITELLIPYLYNKCTYVPPQNSSDVTEPPGPMGSAIRSSTGIPMDTTRTGSGYTYNNITILLSTSYNLKHIQNIKFIC